MFDEASADSEERNDVVVKVIEGTTSSLSMKKCGTNLTQQRIFPSEAKEWNKTISLMIIKICQVCMRMQCSQKRITTFQFHLVWRHRSSENTQCTALQHSAAAQHSAVLYYSAAQ